MSEKLKIAYYVTGHGLGHATRVIEVVPSIHFLPLSRTNSTSCRHLDFAILPYTPMSLPPFLLPNIQIVVFICLHLHSSGRSVDPRKKKRCFNLLLCLN